MSNTMPNIYQIVTDRIIASLENGCVPWKQPWTATGSPRNIVTARPYRGVNTWLLRSLNFASPYFLSFRQAEQMGASIKKGEKSCPVVYWKRTEKEDPGTKEKTILWLIRYYHVFNVEQCTGIPERFILQEEEKTNYPIAACKKIVKGMPNPPAIKTSKIQDEAYYVPTTDTVFMPPLDKFTDSESYYITQFHELIHSTGHQTRLSRPGVTTPNQFGSERYSQEELVAEMGACFLASAANILDLHFDNSAAYIEGWLKRLKNDRMLIFKASGQAQKASDYILNVAPIFESEVPKEGVAAV